MNEWPERRARWIWKPIEDLAWCRRKMAEMTEVEREFVEAAVFDAEGNFAPDLDRMKAMLAEYPSLVETAGAAALTAAIRGKDTDEVVRFLVDNGARFEYPKDAFSPVHDAVWSASHGQQGIEKFRIIFESGLADAAQIGIRPPHNGTDFKPPLPPAHHRHIRPSSTYQAAAGTRRGEGHRGAVESERGYGAASCGTGRALVGPPPRGRRNPAGARGVLRHLLGLLSR